VTAKALATATAAAVHDEDMQLDLTDEAADDMRHVLDSAISDLSPEIADTDNFEYREELKAKRARLQALRAQLDGK
jgi:hypothetical protein